MTWTPTILNIKDAGGTNQPVIAYTDGTNFSFAHPLLDNTGAIIAPATAGNQTTANTSLATIATAIQAAIPAGTNTIGAVAAGVNVIAGNTTTRPANTTAYSLGQLVANSTTAGSVTPATIAAARGINIPTAAIRCRLQKSNTGTTNAIFRVHFFSASPTVTNGDGGGFTPQLASYCGSFDVTVNQAGSDYAVGIGLPTYGPAMVFAPASGTSNLYYLIEARAAYTPASGEVFTPYLEIQ